MPATEQARELVQIASAVADAKGGEDLVALDVSGPLPLVDAFLLVTGRNERNVGAIAASVEGLPGHSDRAPDPGRRGSRVGLARSARLRHPSRFEWTLRM